MKMSSGSNEGEQVVKVELGLKTTNENQIDHSHPFLSDDNHDSGSTFNVYKYDNNSNNINISLSNVVNVPSSYYYSSLIPSNSYFKSTQGGVTTGAMGFPFTALQWKELERQAMIYKYMMASLPIPADLLYSSLSSPSSTFAPDSYYMGKYGVGSGISVRWIGNNKDAEPGRCRRTDGKKWRCSRDVAPNSKYCEHHMHRGRTRSRKHVEQQQQQLLHQSLFNNPAVNNNNKAKDNLAKKTRLNNDQSNGSCIVQPCKGAIFDQPMVTNANLFDELRNLAWNDDQQWHNLMQTDMNTSVFQHQLELDPLKNNMGSFERPLFDAWSMGVTETKDNAENHHKFPLSPTINSNQGSTIDEDMCQIHMGLGLIDSWVTSSNTTPGGPLAEVLRPGTRESDFVTPPQTAVSSPSGVLQKTLATFSDSSGSNSPVCHNSNPNSDMPFHWLN